MPEEPKWGWIDNHPMVGLSYSEVELYINWLNSTTGNVYRLPTEIEWEYAARAGNDNATPFSGGKILDEVGWNFFNSDSMTHAVGLKKPNSFGIYDMSGNVSEFCSDWYVKNYADRFQSNETRVYQNNQVKVTRGGSFFHDDYGCKVWKRSGDSVDIEARYLTVGFRLASTIKPK